MIKSVLKVVNNDWPWPAKSRSLLFKHHLPDVRATLAKQKYYNERFELIAEAFAKLVDRVVYVDWLFFCQR